MWKKTISGKIVKFIRHLRKVGSTVTESRIDIYFDPNFYCEKLIRN